jgi:hypothetical protein
MGEVSKKYDSGNNQKIINKRCFILEMVSIRRGRIKGEEETCKTTLRGQKKKDSLRERFIKNKRPLNCMHIFPKREK